MLWIGWNTLLLFFFFPQRSSPPNGICYCVLLSETEFSFLLCYYFFCGVVLPSSGEFLSPLLSCSDLTDRFIIIFIIILNDSLLPSDSSPVPSLPGGRIMRRMPLSISSSSSPLYPCPLSATATTSTTPARRYGARTCGT